VEVVVFDQRLAPGVQDSEEADLSFQPPLGIATELLKGGVDLAKEQVEQGLAVVTDERVELVREGEDDVEVRDRDQLAHALGQPSLPRRALAGRAMAVAAGVVQYGLMAAGRATPDVSAERRGAALEEMADGLLLECGDAVSPLVIGPMGAEHIGHPQGRPGAHVVAYPAGDHLEPGVPDARACSGRWWRCWCGRGTA
jgi:hypothetical protein